MNSVNDQQLLRDYAERRSETAFAELVRRNVDLVYSAAHRLVRDAHLAEDVTQGVFLALAQNAGQLADRPVLSGWLHGTTRNLAANAVRSEVRRHAREQEAAAMNELLAAEPDALWQQVAPNLDAALGELNESDREVLLLRYFKNQSLREVGQTLGTSEDAAQKRVSRAVDQLRGFLAKRGVTVGTSGLVVAMAANAVQAAPVGLAVTISTAAALAGTTIAATVSTTATNALAMTTLQKAIIGATLVAALGTGIYEARRASTLRTQVQTLQQQQASLVELDQLRTEKERLAARLQVDAVEMENLRKGRDELLRLRGQVGVLRQELAEARQHATEPAAQTNDLAKTWAVGEIKPKGDWKNAGLGSPVAAVETFWWAAANNNAERMKQCIVFDRKTNAEPVSELYAKREAQFNAGLMESLQASGVRLLSHRFDMLDSDRAKIEVAVIGRLPHADGTLADITDQKELQLLRVSGEWKVVRDPELVRLSIWDDDSEAVAKMMMRMDPKTLEQLKSDPRLPLQTLRAYEDLKAKGTQ